MFNDEKSEMIKALTSENEQIKIDHENKKIYITKYPGTVLERTEEYDIGWAPFPKNNKYNFGSAKKSSQELFMWSTDHFPEVLFHGTRGIGKTEALIACFVQLCGQGYGSSWRGVIFRKTYKALTDLIRKSKDIIPRIFPEARFKASKSELCWVFPDGEMLTFDVLKDGKEGNEKYEEYHGQELSFMGFDEITRLKDLEIYKKLKSCLRVSSAKGKTPPLLVRATTNPDGPGKNVVKKYFIDNADEYGVTTETHEIGRGKNKRVYKRERLHIKGSYLENPFLPEDYEVNLMESCEGDKARLAAWLYGDWDAVTGGMFGDNWESEVHVLQPFKIPYGWSVNRAIDWGTSSPFAVGWWAKTDGTPVRMKNGEILCPPPGSLIMIHEYYGCKENKPEQGLKFTPAQVAEMIKIHDKKLYEAGILQGLQRIEAGPADSNMFHSNKMVGVPSEASIMEDNGVEFKMAIKGKNSRIKGANLLNQRLYHTLEENMSNPHIYIFSTCKYWIKNVPVLGRDENNPEDVAEGGCDHDYDMTRYRLMEEEFETFTTNSFG